MIKGGNNNIVRPETPRFLTDSLLLVLLVLRAAPPGPTPTPWVIIAPPSFRKPKTQNKFEGCGNYCHGNITNNDRAPVALQLCGFPSGPVLRVIQAYAPEALYHIYIYIDNMYIDK